MENCFVPIRIVESLLSPESLSQKCEFILNSLIQTPTFDFSNYFRVFALTCILEAPFYFWALRGLTPRQSIAALFLANLATHPFIYFGLPKILSGTGATDQQFLITAELFVPIVEALLLWRAWKLKPLTALTTSILANLFSWDIGARILY